MKRDDMRCIIFCFALVFAGAPAAAQQIAQDREWLAHCVSQILETNKPRARQYCACMEQTVDTSEKLRQTELERMWPPMHQACFKKARFTIPR